MTCIFIATTKPLSIGLYRFAYFRNGLLETAKFEIGQECPTGGSLASVDEGLGELLEGYGVSRIVMIPRDPQWAYAYWDIPNEHKEELRRQGGQQLALRLYDVTDINLDYQAPHNIQEFLCDEMAREWYLPIPVSDRDYVVDIGYRCGDGRWLSLTRSAPVRVPPEYPSDWIEEHFVTVNFDEDLRGRNVYELGSPTKGITSIHDEIFKLSQNGEEQRITGSLFGSMQQAPISSYVFPSGMGMSGVGFSASMPPLRSRKFWLVADAKLIVHGATEPDATVTIGDHQIQLNPDGTFRFEMSFQDGTIDYPIMAVAKDGEQTRSIHMNFTRKTLERRTNIKEEAIEELLIPEGLTPKEWLAKFQISEEFLRYALDKIQKELEILLREIEVPIEFPNLPLPDTGGVMRTSTDIVRSACHYVFGNEEKFAEIRREVEDLVTDPGIRDFLYMAIGLPTSGGRNIRFYPDFQRENPPTPSEMAQVITPILLAADIEGKISIPSNQGWEEIIAYAAITTTVAYLLKEAERKGFLGGDGPILPVS